MKNKKTFEFLVRIVKYKKRPHRGKRPIMSKPRFFFLFLGFLFFSESAMAQMTWQMNEGEGTITLLEREVPVFTYNYGPQLKAGVPDQFERSCYIHPLYGLDGTVLTADFPLDHLHHRGLFWTWPEIRVRDQKTQTWHPANLRQYFVRWIQKEAKRSSALLHVENAWKLNKKEVVARETISLIIHPVDKEGRRIDLTIELEAVDGPMTLKGASEGNKGYGGLCLRGAGMFKGAVLSTDKGIQEEDATNTQFLWADLNTKNYGVSITVDQDHPGYPIPWLIRRGYAGILNPSWPGIEPATLEPGSPVTLSYTILIHKGFDK
jgi:hypothetical protein